MESSSEDSLDDKESDEYYDADSKSSITSLESLTDEIEAVVKECKCHSEQLLTSLKLLKSDDRFCDVTIMTSSGEIRAHKNILAAATDYFKGLFLNTNESETAIVDFTEMPAEVVSQCIEFIYSGTVEISMTIARDLLDASQMMQLPELSKLCVQFLAERVDMETCADVINLSNHYCKDSWDVQVEKFLIENFTEFSETEGFLSLNCDSLVCILDLLQRSIKNREVEKWKAIVRWTKWDLENRKSDFPKLFQSIGLSCFTRSFIKDHVYAESLVFDSKECLQQVAAVAFGHDNMVYDKKKQSTLNRILACNKESRLIHQYHVKDKKWSKVARFPHAFPENMDMISYKGVLYVSSGYQLFAFSNGSWIELSKNIFFPSKSSTSDCQSVVIGSLQSSNSPKSVTTNGKGGWLGTSQKPTAIGSVKSSETFTSSVFGKSGLVSSKCATTKGVGNFFGTKLKPLNLVGSQLFNFGSIKSSPTSASSGASNVYSHSLTTKSEEGFFQPSEKTLTSVGGSDFGSVISSENSAISAFSGSVNVMSRSTTKIEGSSFGAAQKLSTRVASSGISSNTESTKSSENPSFSGFTGSPIFASKSATTGIDGNLFGDAQKLSTSVAKSGFPFNTVSTKSSENTTSSGHSDPPIFPSKSATTAIKVTSFGAAQKLSTDAAKSGFLFNTVSTKSSENNATSDINESPIFAAKIATTRSEAGLSEAMQVSTIAVSRGSDSSDNSRLPFVALPIAASDCFTTISPIVLSRTEQTKSDFIFGRLLNSGDIKSSEVSSGLSALSISNSTGTLAKSEGGVFGSSQMSFASVVADGPRFKFGNTKSSQNFVTSPFVGISNVNSKSATTKSEGKQKPIGSVFGVSGLNFSGWSTTSSEKSATSSFSTLFKVNPTSVPTKSEGKSKGEGGFFGCSRNPLVSVTTGLSQRKTTSSTMNAVNSSTSSQNLLLTHTTPSVTSIVSSRQCAAVKCSVPYGIGGSSTYNRCIGFTNDVFMITRDHLHKYSTQSLEWTSKAIFTGMGEGFFVAVSSSKMYLMGGEGSERHLREVDLISTKVDSLSSMVGAKNCGHAFWFDEKIFAFGGKYPATVECYDPEMDGWTLIPNLTIDRHPAKVFIGEKLYLIGGDLEDEFEEIEVVKLKFPAVIRKANVDMFSCCPSS